MKRLTKRWDNEPYPNLAGRVVCEYKECDSGKSCNDCVHGRIAQRLAAIEDILGDNYDLNDIEKAFWCMNIVKDAFSNGPKATERLRELWFADQKGHCVVFDKRYPVVSEYYQDEEGRYIREASGVISEAEYMRAKGGALKSKE